MEWEESRQELQIQQWETQQSQSPVGIAPDGKMPFSCPQDWVSESYLRGNSKKAIFGSWVYVDGTSLMHYAIVTSLGIGVWFCLMQNKNSPVLIEKGIQTSRSNPSELLNLVTHWLTSVSQGGLEPATAGSKSFLAHQCQLSLWWGEPEPGSLQRRPWLCLD